MLIPYDTDAPIYHWPLATVGLIAINIAVYVACTIAANQIELEDALSARAATGESAEEFAWEDELEDLYAATAWERALEPWILHHGTFRPWEWVTSNFIHGDLLHLLGNMAVLWGLGLIVEGKVGQNPYREGGPAGSSRTGDGENRLSPDERSTKNGPRCPATQSSAASSRGHN